MKLFKRILIFGLVAIMCFGFVACGKNDTDGGQKKNLGAEFDFIDRQNEAKVIKEPTFEMPSNLAENPDLFSPSALICDKMVLQRNAVNCIFGQTKEKNIAVRIDGIVYYGVVENGQFRVYIAPHKQGEGYTLELLSEHGKMKFTDVCFGEVFLLSGQSNMAWTMGSSVNGDFGMHTGKYIPTAKDDPETYQSYAMDSKERNNMIKDSVFSQLEEIENPKLRIFKIAVQPETSNVYDTIEPAMSVFGKWQTATYESMSEFSAVGTSFGKTLLDLIDIPVGLVSAALGATFVPTWTPIEAYNANKDSFVYGGDSSAASYNKAGRCYGQYISPIKGYKFRSVIWYQGEGQPSKYADSMITLINAWRENFGYELPFIIIQLPRFGENDTLPTNYVAMGTEAPSLSLMPFKSREEQNKIADTLDGCTYSVNIDLGDYDELHPYDKKEVGIRAAQKVMEYFFKTEGVWSGGYYSSFTKVGSAVQIVFKNVGGGIQLINDSINLEVAGDDDIFYPAKAELLSNDKILVSSDTVSNIKQIRYGANNYPRITRNNMHRYLSLFTKEGYSIEQFSIRV